MPATVSGLRELKRLDHQFSHWRKKLCPGSARSTSPSTENPSVHMTQVATSEFLSVFATLHSPPVDWQTHSHALPQSDKLFVDTVLWEAEKARASFESA
jgi:hypothetical protein